MKTTKIFQTALAAGMVCFATLANAQNYEYVTHATTGKTSDDVAKTQADFVTVGAQMPYTVDATQPDLAGWLTELTTAGITGVTAATHVAWTVNGTALTGTDDLSQIGVQWNTTGDYTLRAFTSIDVKVNSVSVTPPCNPHEEIKKVYVLPEPTVAFTTANTVLSCGATTQTVSYEVTGIGQKQVAYTVTKKPYTTSGSTDSPVSQNIGGGVSNTGVFQEDLVSYTNAIDDYYTIASPTGSNNITVNGLQNGYIYTVEITSLSDQISRKSGVTVTVPTTAKVSFAVVPEAVDTKINHVKNIE